MQLVVADTSPISYLILIGHIGVLPTLFEKVVLPSLVRDELDDGPPNVRLWIANAPPWVQVSAVKKPHQDSALRYLHAGEQASTPLSLFERGVPG